MRFSILGAENERTMNDLRENQDDVAFCELHGRFLVVDASHMGEYAEEDYTEYLVFVVRWCSDVRRLVRAILGSDLSEGEDFFGTQVFHIEDNFWVVAIDKKNNEENDENNNNTEQEEEFSSETFFGPEGLGVPLGILFWLN